MGNALALFTNLAWWDVLVHFVLPLFTAPALYILLARLDVVPDLDERPSTRRHAGIVIVTAALGVLVGAVYEMYEYFNVRVFGGGLHVGYADTIADLFDTRSRRSPAARRSHGGRRAAGAQLGACPAHASQTDTRRHLDDGLGRAADKPLRNPGAARVANGLQRSSSIRRSLMATRDPYTEPHARTGRRRRRGRFSDHDLTGAAPPADVLAPGGRRDQVIAVAALNVIAGIWLIISPWVIGYESGDARWNPIVFGALVMVFALVRIAMPARTAALSACNAAIGVWLFISGFWLADSAGASWNAWILGVIVFVLACAGLVSTRDDGPAA